MWRQTKPSLPPTAAIPQKLNPAVPLEISGGSVEQASRNTRNLLGFCARWNDFTPTITVAKGAVIRSAMAARPGRRRTHEAWANTASRGNTNGEVNIVDRTVPLELFHLLLVQHELGNVAV